ncbi:MAG: thermonuclease family protein, partial [Terriglobia bacterium]
MRRRRFARIGIGGKKRRVIILVLSLVVSAAYLLRREGIDFSRPQDAGNCGGSAGCFTGVVNRVIDGDTLEVNGERIRLVLVDAPERDTRSGPSATEYLRELCPVGSTALVDQDDLQRRDNYDRMLAVVWCGETRVNEAIIRAGRARLYRRFCRQSEFGSEPWA